MPRSSDRSRKRLTNNHNKETTHDTATIRLVYRSHEPVPVPLLERNTVDEYWLIRRADYGSQPWPEME